MEELRSRLEELARLGGKLDRRDDFNAELKDLLAEVRDALVALRQVEALQTAWLARVQDEVARRN